MTLNVRDPDVLNALQPSEVEAYLQAHHWQEQNRISDLGAIWKLHTSYQKSEILLPLQSDLADFALRMSQVLETLATVEQRSKFEVLGDLLTSAPNAIVQGIVIKLQETADTGKVTIMGVVVGKLRRIHFDLAEPAYDLAIKAYQARISVICQGDLVKQGRYFTLQNPQHFTLDLQTWID